LRETFFFHTYLSTPDIFNVGMYIELDGDAKYIQ